MNDQAALFDTPDRYRALRAFRRCWQPWVVSAPLAGCGPLHPSNPDPYWPAYASAAAAWQFDVGGFQEAWGRHLSGEVAS